MTPLTDRAGRFSVLKTLTFALLLLPAMWIAHAYQAGDLGALPVKEAMRQTGLWSVRLLLVTLAFTPAQRFLGWGRLALVRRMVGLGAASYAGAHLALYAAMEHFDWRMVLSEIALRRYLTLGIIAVVGLTALAATSTDSMLRRLGPKWKTLHRLVYAIVPLGLLHFFMQAKINVSAAVLLAGLFLLLMAHRFVLSRRLVQPAWGLAVAALAAGVGTGLVEMLWYAVASGISPWRVAAANFGIMHGLRPAAVVLLTGLAAAFAVWVRGFLRTPPEQIPRRLKTFATRICSSVLIWRESLSAR